METLNAAINQVNTILWSYVLIVLLIGLGLYFTFRTGFVQIRLVGEMVRLLAEGIGTERMGNQISSFQAFCVSTASRVGVGNIAGVAIAIVLGGPGAIFWMWMVAIVGSATGFVESTLAQIYKLPRGKWTFHGGPAYYIQNVLHMPNLAKLFSLLLMTTFALVYNSLQANTITLSLQTAFGWDRMVVGVVVSVLIALVICGGAHFVARVAEMLVPVMAGAYLLLAFIVILLNFEKIPEVIYLIVSNAFAPQAAVAGGFGACVMNGVKRGLFSNEAGEGSVPNAAATAFVTHPAKQGLIQAFGVYVDTLLICSASAALVLLSGAYEIGGADHRYRTDTAQPVNRGGQMGHLIYRYHDHDVCLQFPGGQLLLRRNQSGLPYGKQNSVVCVPGSRGSHDHVREHCIPAAGVEPGRFVHGFPGRHQPVRHRPPVPLCEDCAGRLRKTARKWI